MANLNDLVRQYTNLSGEERNHLRRLVAGWSMLADLSFADLLLLAPVELTGPETAPRWVILGQMRPTTAQTVYRDDLVGRFAPSTMIDLVADVYGDAEQRRGEHRSQWSQSEHAARAIPVVVNGRPIGVLLAETHRDGSRRAGDLEAAYSTVFDRLAVMVAQGTFPFSYEDIDTEESPRVGDGVIVLDNAGAARFCSPNAVSALHRIGFHANVVGRDFADAGFHDDALRTAFRLRVPVTEEVERGSSVSILARVLPLIVDDQIDGALVLIRDVSELRRRERLMVSMDATIREIHHRVKNNLQTVSSLLRLQGRRLESPEAKEAIEESVRRIRSIALVHEILARNGGDDVAFGEVVRSIVSMVEHALVSPDRPVAVTVVGDGPTLPASAASSLAVIVTELLQNAVEHGYPAGHPGGRVVVELETDPDELVVRVHDDGVGLPPGFVLENDAGLGLTIVRTLASGELDGQLSVRSASSGPHGAVAALRVSLQQL